MIDTGYAKLTDLSITGFDFSELVGMEEIGGSSYYLFDQRKLRENVMDLKRALGSGVLLSYSVKANPWLAKYAGGFVDDMEICSPGELKNAIMEKWDLSHVTLDGLLKTENEIDAAIKRGVARISIDSPSQWDMVSDCAKKRGKRLRVLLRLSSGSQFGMTAEEILEIIKKHGESKTLYIEGLHYYLGTQRRNAAEIRTVFCHLEDILDEIQKRTGRQMDLFELGGGAPVPYFEEDNEDDYQSAFVMLAGCVKRLSARVPVIYEAGRILAASAGCYVSKIIGSKDRSGRRIVIAEGGTHQLSYYGSIAGRKTPKIKSVFQDKKGSDTWEDVTVCGSLCTSQDIMARKVRLQMPKRGTYLIFGLAGAYSVTECGNDFLCRSKPAILMHKEDGEIEVLRSPEEIDFEHLQR